MFRILFLDYKLDKFSKNNKKTKKFLNNKKTLVDPVSPYVPLAYQKCVFVTS